MFKGKLGEKQLLLDYLQQLRQDRLSKNRSGTISKLLHKTLDLSQRPPGLTQRLVGPSGKSARCSNALARRPFWPEVHATLRLARGHCVCCQSPTKTPFQLLPGSCQRLWSLGDLCCPSLSAQAQGSPRRPVSKCTCALR